MQQPIFPRLHLLLFVLCLACSTTPPVHRQESPPVPTATPPPTPTKTKGIPKSAITILDHKYFEVHYDPHLRLARYVKYTLTKNQLLRAKNKRKDRFRVDPLLRAMNLPAVEPREYTRSGYDRGHLAPAADFAWSPEASDQTFVMSNMAPQKPNLNRQAWRMLEEQVRKWACGEERVIVITGPIFEDKPQRLKSGLPIPKEFFKVVIDDSPPRKGIGFIYSQDDKNSRPAERVVALQVIESKTKENLSDLSVHQERQPAQVDAWKECEP